MHHPHDSTSRTFTAVPAIAHAGPPDPPLDWQVYGDSYHIG